MGSPPLHDGRESRGSFRTLLSVLDKPLSPAAVCSANLSEIIVGGSCDAVQIANSSEM
jgi:hypothetical protein